MANTSSNISVAPLLAVNFVGTLGFSIVVPFLVVLVTKWGGNAVVYGILAATYSFFQLFGAPILGHWSDKVGRRKVLLFSQLGTLISWGIFLLAFMLPTETLVTINGSFLGDFAITAPLVVLFIARAADGLTGGNVSVSNAYLADITREKDRSKNFGQMAISGNLGFIVGPAIAGFLGATLLGEILPVFAAFTISAATLVLIQFGLKEVPPAPITEHLEPPSCHKVFGHEHKPGYKVKCEQPSGWRTMLALPNMPGLMSINFLVMLGFSFFYAAFPIYAMQSLSWEIVEMGMYFAFLSFAMVVVQGPVLAWAAARATDKTLMAIGSLFLCLGFVAIVPGNTQLIYIGAVLIALGNGLMWPTFMAILSKAAGSQLQGAVQGIASSAGAVASITGLVVGGLAFVQFGGAVFGGAAGIILIVAAIAALQPT